MRTVMYVMVIYHLEELPKLLMAAHVKQPTESYFVRACLHELMRRNYPLKLPDPFCIAGIFIEMLNLPFASSMTAGMTATNANRASGLATPVRPPTQRLQQAGPTAPDTHQS